MATDEKIFDSVKDYYGKVLNKTEDLKTSACITGLNVMPKHVKDAVSQVHEEVTARYYGCGLVIPEKLEGMHVLDLGSGSGRDCFALSKLVGQNGFVTGIDMTDEQLKVARDYVEYHTEKFGYSTPNVKFIQGYIERLTEAGIPENSQNIIISNCVINLSPDKKSVLSEAYKVLKVGGELYFSDVYADREVSESARKHEVLWGECISGALWWKELYRLAEEIGFSRPRLVRASEIPIEREDFKQVLGDARFVSVTYRLFKLPNETQPARQVIYKGEITGFPDQLNFDHQNVFQANDIVDVDEELSTILSASRFADEFEFQPVSKHKKDTRSNCCTDKDVEVDPFDYIADRLKRGEKMDKACCSQKCC
ncbi:hypothetical protein ACJMK2_006707 [Sinanodonta woodiana]|uniref:Arsenite methyltransferase n=1 Tax=Sinanodonta woodiana TaxID=1069815 RepID=A0ABD3VU06_SINWO